MVAEPQFDGTEYYPEEIDLTALSRSIGGLLKEEKLTVCTAESCTGGLLSSVLTMVSGASSYYMGSVIAYSNEVKNKILGVPQDILINKGAVSPETANLLASGVRALLGAAIGIGITGIAGPEGGTPEKPVGLVYIALNSATVSWCHGFYFRGDRQRIRLLSVNAALQMLKQYVLAID